MYLSTSYKTKQFFQRVLKFFIVIGCGYFIIAKFTQNEQISFSDFLSKTKKNNVFLLKNVILLLFFSFFNWFFEILKWQNLVNTLQKITLNRLNLHF